LRRPTFCRPIGGLLELAIFPRFRCEALYNLPAYSRTFRADERKKAEKPDRQFDGPIRSTS
jgi:hypothetical protein